MNLSPTSAHRLSPPIITYMHSFEITYIRSNIFYHNFLQRIKHTLLLISKESNKPPANSTHEKEKLKFFIFLSKLEKKKKIPFDRIIDLIEPDLPSLIQSSDDPSSWKIRRSIGGTRPNSRFLTPRGMKGKKREREWMSNAVIFHHRYANDKSTASWSDTGKKTIQNRSERHFHASCSLLYRHPSICILYNRIFPSFFFSFFLPIRKQHRDSTGYIVVRNG